MPDSEVTPLTEARVRAIRSELRSLLASPAFRTSKRCRDFLAYVVEQTLKGCSDSLKERCLGVEIFQLPPDFDASQHTIVRVTANEVRKKLAQHYLASTSSPHPVRIELPPGSYRAEFKWEKEPAPAERETVAPAPSSPPAGRPRARRSWFVAGLAVLLVAAAGFAVWRFPASNHRSRVASPAVAAGVAAASTSSEDAALRIIAGATGTHLDRSGRSWGPDRFFSGGIPAFRPSERILRTLDPDIYRHARVGQFRYDIPLTKGTYELHLHFAETGLADSISAESSGEGQRLFHVLANGKPILLAFDVVADAAGANTADERVFRDVTPAEDGILHLSFVPVKGSAMVSAIELLPTPPGKVRPIRIRPGWTTSWRDPSGQAWQSDSYFLGGNALVRSMNPAGQAKADTEEAALCASERWGHFSYAVPVAEGRYRLSLKFCEGHYGAGNSGRGGTGSRVFDVYCNGAALLRNFDIYREAEGAGRLIERVFSGVRSNAQGKIVLTFVPVRGMACVNAIEVVEDTR